MKKKDWGLPSEQPILFDIYFTFIWYLFGTLFVAEKESYFDSCPTFNISQLISEMHSSNYTISTTEY